MLVPRTTPAAWACAPLRPIALLIAAACTLPPPVLCTCRPALFLHSARITETFLAAAHGGRRCALQVRAVPNLLALPHGIVCCLWRVAWPGDPEREECATAFQLATSSVRPSLRCSASCRDQHYTSALVTVLLVTGGWAVSGVGATYFHDRRCLGWVQFCLSGRNYIRHLLCLFMSHIPLHRPSVPLHWLGLVTAPPLLHRGRGA